MILTETPLKNAYIVEPEPHQDARGFFARTWCQHEATGHGLNPRLVTLLDEQMTTTIPGSGPYLPTLGLRMICARRDQLCHMRRPIMLSRRSDCLRDEVIQIRPIVKVD